jgi:hypothetical protein
MFSSYGRPLVDCLFGLAENIGNNSRQNIPSGRSGQPLGKNIYLFAAFGPSSVWKPEFNVNFFTNGLGPDARRTSAGCLDGRELAQ